jgi:hypothetical protein
LGEIGPATLEQHARATRSDVLARRRRCQTDFYIALRALDDGDAVVFQQRLVACAQSDGGLLEHEFYLARWEVEVGFTRLPIQPP